MLGSSLFDLKSKILDELLDDMDSHESEKLKPKAAISVTAVKPEDEAVLESSPDEGKDAMPDDMAASLGAHQDNEDDEDLKMLLEHYLGNK